MNMYPAICSRMGTWLYYMVRMTMRDVAKEVQFASELLNDPSLDEAIQRTLNVSRANREIAFYLKKRPDRFFSSLVVAAMGGDPLFYPVSVEPTGEQSFFSGATFDQAFGILRFNDDRKYYALDGQHRLKAIKSTIDSIDKGESLGDNIDSEAFAMEQLSVLMVCANRDDRNFKTDYRRLFSSLNRYAKPTDSDTNIIMDEDDAIAILTRRLINDHDFFKTRNGQFRIQTKGKQMKRIGGRSSSCFTSLQTLYAMNEKLLISKVRGHRSLLFTKAKFQEFKKVRPTDEDLESFYNDLAGIWNGLTQTLPGLNADPASQRDFSDAGIHQANLLFMPIGQEVMAEVARILLDRGDDKSDTLKLLAPLKKISWKLNAPPWKHLFLVQDDDEAPWKMRPSERQPAQDIARKLVMWQLGLPSEEEKVLYKEWCSRLRPAQREQETAEMWRQIKES